VVGRVGRGWIWGAIVLLTSGLVIVLGTFTPALTQRNSVMTSKAIGRSLVSQILPSEIFLTDIPMAALENRDKPTGA